MRSGSAGAQTQCLCSKTRTRYLLTRTFGSARCAASKEEHRRSVSPLLSAAIGFASATGIAATALIAPAAAVARPSVLIGVITVIGPAGI